MKKKKADLKGEIKIPELSMRQICDRYFQRKVNFLSLDIEGYEYKALEGNDWNNPLCRP